MVDPQFRRAAWALLKSEKDFALAAVAVVLVVVGLLLVSLQGRGFAPFVYAGF
jgi:hypothetical protein